MGTTKHKVKRRAAFLVIILILFGYLFLESKNSVVQNTIKQYNHQERIKTDLVVKGLENFFDPYISSLKYLSNLPQIMKFTSQSEFLMDQFFEQNKINIGAITRLDKEANIIYSVPDKSAIGKNVRFQPHNEAVIKSQQFHISDVFTSVQGFMTIAVHQPIFKDDKFDGAIALLLSFDNIAKNSLANINLKTQTQAYLVSSEGVILYSTEYILIGKSIKTDSRFASLLGTVESLDKNGLYSEKKLTLKEEPDLSSAGIYHAVLRKIPLHNTHWNLILISPEEVILSQINYFSELWLLLIVVTLLCISIFSYFIYKAVVIIKNEAERKEINVQLLHAKEEAEKANRMKSEFLAQMSHEIRSPINSILSFSQLLQEDLRSKISKDLEDGFKIIHNGGRRITRTIDLILNMAEVQTGTYEPAKKRIDLVIILTDLYDEYKRLATENELKLVFNKTVEHAWVEADEYSLTQIFGNLIDNSIKYTLNGKIDLTVSGNKEIVVTVEDTGIGISEEYLPHIFEPFTQEESGYTRRFEGNGLGMALVRNYCDMNSGKIEVESEKGRGTKFTVKFQS
ncbi:MAG: sensor histidine kinase [Bacteroidetes bacterium]|nr:sensor histidine kinase [Bacteroidota bacterium]